MESRPPIGRWSASKKFWLWAQAIAGVIVVVALVGTSAPAEAATPVAFAAAATYPVHSSPYAVAVGELTHNGRSDVVTANLGTNDVSVLLSEPSGALELAKNINVGGGVPVALAIGDVNGDGNNDIVVAVAEPNEILVLPGDGNGNFGAPITSPLPTLTVPTFLAVGDFNKDHKLDLVTANGGEGTISIALGNGDGTFKAATAKTYKASAESGTNIATVRVADFNHDGNLDVASATGGCGYLHSTGEVEIHLGNGGGELAQNPVAAVLDSCVASMNVADVNKDGIPDIVTANEEPQSGGGYLATILGKGNGTVGSLILSPATAFPVGAAALTLPDLNGDGLPDAALATAGGAIAVLPSNGDGAFSTPETFSANATYVSAITYGDFNGDGKPDIVTADSQSGGGTANGAVSVFLNSTSFALPPAQQGPTQQPTQGPFPICKPVSLPAIPITVAPFALSSPIADFSPLPLTVVANARIASVTFCDQGTAVSPPFVSLEYDVNGATGQRSFQFNFDASAWTNSPLQDRGNFNVAGVQVHPDFTSIQFSVDPEGNIEVPIAILNASPQNALLVDNPFTEYLSLTSREVGEIAAKFNPRDFFDALRFFAQVAPLAVAVYNASAILASEIAGGISELAPNFPGLIVDPALPGYSQTLIDALGGWVGIQHLTSLISHLPDGPPVGLIVVGGVAVVGGVVVCVAACPVAAAVGALAAVVTFLGGSRLVTARIHRASSTGAHPPTAFVRLTASQVRHVDPRSLRRAPLTDLRAAITASFGLPFDAIVRPLAVNQKVLRARERITVIAGRLTNIHRHKIALVVLGPGYSGRRPLIANLGFAGAAITMPAHMQPGRWIIATEDLSNIRVSRGKKPVGRADDRVGVFTVAPPHQPHPKRKRRH